MGRQPPSRKQVSALRVTKTDKEADASLPDRIASNPVIRTTPLVITQGGTADNPAIFDGQGMIIDLGIDISDHDWQKNGDLWTSREKLLDQEPVIAGQVAGLFVGAVPITIPRDVEAEKTRPDRKSRCYYPPEKLLPGQMGFTENGAAYFRWPANVLPGSVAVIHPGKGGASWGMAAPVSATVLNIGKCYTHRCMINF